MKQESKDKPYVPLHQLRSTSVDKDKQKQTNERNAKNLRMDMALVFGTDEGKRVLRWIMAECGWGKSVIGGNPSIGLDAAQGTIYNASRLGIYLELRSLIAHSILSEVEYEQKLTEVLND